MTEEDPLREGLAELAHELWKATAKGTIADIERELYITKGDAFMDEVRGLACVNKMRRDFDSLPRRERRALALAWADRALVLMIASGRLMASK